MTTAAPTANGAAERPAGRSPSPRAVLRAVALPTEHGGWALTLEPVVLGLLVAPSGASVALGLAALVAFVARTPTKIVLVDRWRRRHLARTRVATGVAAVELVVLTALLAVAWSTATAPFWVPLACAVPLVTLEVWFDMRSRSRRLVPELAGTIGIGSVAAAIVLAHGDSPSIAAAAWTVVAARAIASVPFVRLQLQRAKHQPHRRWAVDLTQLGAFAFAALASIRGWLPPVAALAIAALVAAQLVLARVPPPKAPVLGAQQVVLGLTVVLVAALAILAP
jgi:YwiC-like protein